MDQRNGDEMTEFFHMGGYASYVWSSYGIAFISLLITMLLPLRTNTAIIKRLKGRYKREQIQEQEAQETAAADNIDVQQSMPTNMQDITPEKKEETS